MTKKYIFDSSALLAILKDEPSHDIAEGLIEQSVMCSINVAEVLNILNKANIPIQTASKLVRSIIKEFIDCGFAEAQIAAHIKNQYSTLGISMGDSFCLAVGKIYNFPIVTADRIWEKCKIGTKIIIIR